MKRLCVLLVLLSLFIVSCGDETGNDSDEELVLEQSEDHDLDLEENSGELVESIDAESTGNIDESEELGDASIDTRKDNSTDSGVEEADGTGAETVKGYNKIPKTAYSESCHIVDTFKDYEDQVSGRLSEHLEHLGSIKNFVIYGHSGGNISGNIENKLIAINSSDFVIEKELDLPLGEKEELCQMYIKYTSIYDANRIFVMTNKRCLVYDELLEVQEEVELPKFLVEALQEEISYNSTTNEYSKAFLGYDISSDLKDIVYSDDSGLYLYDISYNTIELIQELIPGQDVKKYGKTNVMIHPKFVSKADNIIADIQGWEWSNGFAFYNRKTRESSVYTYVHESRPYIQMNGVPYYAAVDYYEENSQGERIRKPFMMSLLDGEVSELPALIELMDLGIKFNDPVDVQLESEGFYGPSTMFGRRRYIDFYGDSVALYIHEDFDIDFIGDYYDSDGELYAVGKLTSMDAKSGVLLWHVSGYEKSLTKKDNSETVFNDLGLSMDGYDEDVLDNTTKYLGKYTFDSNLEGGFIEDMIVKDNKAYILVQTDAKYLLLCVDIFNPKEGLKVIVDELNPCSRPSMSLALLDNGIILVNVVDEQIFVDTYIDKVIEVKSLFDTYMIASTKDKNLYAYVKNDYQVVQMNGQDKQFLFKGYSNISAGESGFHINVPNSMIYSPSGEYLSFYTSVYEGNEGPFVYDKKGKQVYTPVGLGGDYLSGKWVDGDTYLVTQSVFDNPHTTLLDFGDEQSYSLSMDGSDSIIVSENTGKFVLTERHNGYRPLVIPFRIYDTSDYNRYCNVKLFTEKSDPYSNSVNELYITDEKIISVNFGSGSLTVRTYEYVPEYIEEAPVEVKDLPVMKDYTPITQGIFALANMDESLDLFVMEQLNETYVKVGTIKKGEDLKQIPLVKKDYDYPISVINNQMIMDVESGNILEYNWLKEAVGQNEFNIVAADYAYERIGYITAYEKANLVHVDVFTKNLKETEFIEMDSFTMDAKEFEEEAFYIAITYDKVYFDSYDQESSTRNIKYYAEGNVNIYVNNGKYPSPVSMRNNDILFLDVISGLYKIEKYNEYAFVEQKMPLYQISGGFIGVEKVEGNTLLALWSYEMEDILCQVDIGEDTLFGAIIIGEQLRLYVIHWLEDGGFEVKILDEFY